MLKINAKNCILLDREEQGKLLANAGYASKYFRSYSNQATPFWLEKLTRPQADELLKKYGDKACFLDARGDGEFMVSMSTQMTCRLLAGLMSLHSVTDVCFARGTDLLVVFDDSQAKEHTYNLYGVFFKNKKTGEYDLIKVGTEPDIAWRNAYIELQYKMHDADHDKADSIVLSRTVTKTERTTEWGDLSKEDCKKATDKLSDDFPDEAAPPKYSQGVDKPVFDEYTIFVNRGGRGKYHENFKTIEELKEAVSHELTKGEIASGTLAHLTTFDPSKAKDGYVQKSWRTIQTCAYLAE